MSLPRRVLRDAWAPLAALALCPLVAWLQPGGATVAIDRTGDLAAAERALGIYVEPAVHGWATGVPALMAVACVVYLVAHVRATGGALVWVRLEHPRAWPRLRDTFVLTQLLVLAGAMAAPTAPPSRLPGEGFTDATAAFWGGATKEGAHVLQSPFAALPSGHVAFALVAGGAVAVLARRRWIRACGALYPVLVTAITVVTANHLLLDAVAAAIAVGLALAVSALRHRRPAGRPASATAPRRAPALASERSGTG